MPNRIIKESACNSDSLAAISPQAERLFWRLVVRADDFGCYEARPNVILGTCFTAMMGKVSEVQVNAWLKEISSGTDPLIELYSIDGKQYLHLLRWDKHQQRRAKSPKYPLPPSLASKCEQMHSDARNRNQTQSASRRKQTRANVPVNGNGIGNGNESVNPPSPPRGKRAVDASAPYSEGFERFWSDYPRKVAKREAWGAWLQLVAVGIAEDQIVATASNYARAMHAEDRPAGKMLHAATFLGKKGRYEDYLPGVQPADTVSAIQRDRPPVLTPPPQSVQSDPAPTGAAIEAIRRHLPPTRPRPPTQPAVPFDPDPPSEGEVPI